MNKFRKENLSLILLLILGIIWGSSFLFIKLSVLSIPPVSSVLLRMSVASFCLFVFFLITKNVLPLDQKNIKDYLIIALLGNVIPFILVSWAETEINTNLTGIIMGLMPITTVLLAYFFVKEEKITIFTFIGVLLGFSGLFFLLDIKKNLNENLLSEYSVILATIAFASATVYARRIKFFQPLNILTGSTFFSTIILIPLVFFFEYPFLANPTNQSIFFTIILGVLNTAIGGFIFFRLIKLSGAAFTSTVNFITPFIAIIWGYIFLDEILNSNQFVGLALIMLGIYIVQKSTNT